MKYSETGFRAMYKRFNALMLTDRLKTTIADFPGEDEADCALVYGYIDHEMGFTLEVLAAGKKDGNDFTFSKGNDKIRSFIRIDAAEDCDFYPVDESIGGGFSKKIDILKEYDQPDGIDKTRDMDIIDECRDSICIDDVLVYLIKDDMQPEGCWARIEGIQPPGLEGFLLNEPYQDFGCHEGDMIQFRIQEMRDGKIICFADMN